jgi:hypothetical protein
MPSEMCAEGENDELCVDECALRRNGAGACYGTEEWVHNFEALRSQSKRIMTTFTF